MGQQQQMQVLTMKLPKEEQMLVEVVEQVLMKEQMLVHLLQSIKRQVVVDTSRLGAK